MTPRNSYALLSKQGSFHVSHVILSFVFCSIKLAWKNVYFSFIYSSIHLFFFQHRTEDEQHFVCNEKIRIPRQEFHFQITKTILTYEKYSMKMSTDDNCRSLKHPVVLEIPEKHRQTKTRISHRLRELRLYYFRSAPTVFLVLPVVYLLIHSVV